MGSDTDRKRSAPKRDWGSAEADLVSRIRTATDGWWYLPAALSVAIPVVYLLPEYGLITTEAFETLVSALLRPALLVLPFALYFDAVNVSERSVSWTPSPVIYPGLSLGGLAGGPVLAFPVVVYYTYRRFTHESIDRT